MIRTATGLRLSRVVAAIALTALAGATMPALASATSPNPARYIVVLRGWHAPDGAFALGGDSAANHRRAVEIVERAGGVVAADHSRGSGVMLVDSDRPGFARAVRGEPLVAAVGLSFSWKAFPTLKEAIDRGDLTVLPASEVLSATQTSNSPSGNADAAGGGDPLASRQWDMAMIRTAQAQAIQDGKRRVQVGVLDTGIDSAHPDFTSGTTSNVDTSLGRSFVASSPSPLTDAAFHGTHVAGSIAAQVNGLGIVGVAPGVTLVPLKVCESSGYCFADSVIEGIHYAGEQRLEVINMSFFVDDEAPAGSTQFKCLSDPTQRAWRLAIEREIEYARARGVAPVAAMGNDDIDLNHPEDLQDGATDDDCDQMPTEVKGVTTVVAVGPSGLKSSYSNYGFRKADVSAPGGDGSVATGPCYEVQVLSTLPGGGYGCLQGTSMASPHAAGVAALYVSQFGKYLDGDMRLAVGSVDRALKQTSVDIGVAGYDLCYGHGRVDALRAVKNSRGDTYQSTGCSEY